MTDSRTMRTMRTMRIVSTFLSIGIGLFVAGCGGGGAPTPAPTSAPAAAPTESDTVMTEPDDGPTSSAGGHRLVDLSGVSIPARPAGGTVHGTAFTVEKATLQGDILEIRQGDDFFADRAFSIFLFAGEEPLSGRTFTVAPDAGLGSGASRMQMTPHIHMKYMIEGKSIPEAEMFTEGYAMKLEFGEAAEGRIPTSIYLCIPDEAKSFVAGRFDAEVK